MPPTPAPRMTGHARPVGRFCCPRPKVAGQSDARPTVKRGAASTGSSRKWRSLIGAAEPYWRLGLSGSAALPAVSCASSAIRLLRADPEIHVRNMAAEVVGRWAHIDPGSCGSPHRRQ